jgi:hypothetical protein
MEPNGVVEADTFPVFALNPRAFDSGRSNGVGRKII